MHRIVRVLLLFLCPALACPLFSGAETLSLSNDSTVATFSDLGLAAVKDIASGVTVHFGADRWSLALDNAALQSRDAKPTIHRSGTDKISYRYDFGGYQIEVVYRIAPHWHIVTKELRVLRTPSTVFIVHRIVPVDLELANTVSSAYVPSTYAPQVGMNIAESRQKLPGKDYGAFLRLQDQSGVMLTVQNPFLDVERKGQLVHIGYAPEMQWHAGWGELVSDVACIGVYRRRGERLPREIAPEWKIPPSSIPDDGMDRAEIAAYTDCVREFLINPSPSPTSVEVGWTLNDYQIDVGTPDGVAEYKRIIDTASQLGVRTLLYAPANSKLSERTQSADSWSWEYVLWLGLGQKIRAGAWDPMKDPVPADVQDMIAYAKGKHVGLLAYVYPSIPFDHDKSWIVKGKREKFDYATLASRQFQDYLIHILIAFQRRTGIAGYSFDYTWLNLPGSSSYAQWFGWRRVMDSLRRAVPDIVIDGRQSYQMYGPWSWIAGNYPHPTGTDEQPESFIPYPDLHFDRVSADRTRYVNYWYRNYQFAPTELVPGYATHQTERSMNEPSDAQTGGHPQEVRMMYTRYRPRDWDYLGFRYSFLSSIATGGWNNVIDMIPARDPEEAKHFSAADKAWIRGWLDWTQQNKEFVRHTRSILQPPAIGHVDGTSMIVGDHGYLFVFNPNYRALPATLRLDGTIGLAQGDTFLLRQLYPHKGQVLGKPGTGVWKRGDLVQLSLDGTSATVFEIEPAPSAGRPLVMNAMADGSFVPAAAFVGGTLAVTHAAGEPGSQQEIGVLLPSAATVRKMTVNGIAVQPMQAGRYVSAKMNFRGVPFRQADPIALSPDAQGTLHGTFRVPQAIFAQLAARSKAWPIPWTKEDYETTWLAPERLLLFIQIAEPSDAMNVSATVDGQQLELSRAYTSTRVHGPSFVGFYADLSKIAPNVQHSFTLDLPQLQPAQFQGVFFDNVESRLTEEVDATALP